MNLLRFVKKSALVGFLFLPPNISLAQDAGTILTTIILPLSYDQEKKEEKKVDPADKRPLTSGEILALKSIVFSFLGISLMMAIVAFWREME